MDPRDSHRVGEQNTAYRRGVVLGLTMAEVGILIIFILLLLLGVTQMRLTEQATAMDGIQPVSRERFRALVLGDSLLAEILDALQLTEARSAEEIRRLVLALREAATTTRGSATLRETRRVLEEMRELRDAIAEAGGSEALANEVEKQRYRIANQEGQLRRYEARLEDAGLGKGERPCWVTPDGTIEYLYDVVLSSDGIRMRERQYGHRSEEREILPLPHVAPTEVLSPAEFLDRTLPLYNQSLAANCRFFVVVYDATAPTEKELYKQLLRTVEGHFYKRLDRGPAPF